MKANLLLATLLIALNACASMSAEGAATPSPPSAMEALRRGRDMHWTLQVYVVDSVRAEGVPAMLGSSSVALGGEDIPYAAIDSIYRWSPEPSVFGKRSALTGAVIVGGLGALISGLCYEEWESCAPWLIGGGATLGAFLGASVGGILSPSEGEWEMFWHSPYE